MDLGELYHECHLPAGFKLVPLQNSPSAPLQICVLFQTNTDEPTGPFFLLRSIPGAKIYLGVLCDAYGGIYEWVEIWVQSLDLRDMLSSQGEERLNNSVFDERWKKEAAADAICLPGTAFLLDTQGQHPKPVRVLNGNSTAANSIFTPAEPVEWQLCKDDSLLASFGLPAYSTSAWRYLVRSNDAEGGNFIATAADSPANGHVQSVDQLRTPETAAIFNPQAGFVRLRRFKPLKLEDYLAVLEGQSWNAMPRLEIEASARTIYSELRKWSAKRSGVSFLLHHRSTRSEALNEIFLLKISILHSMLLEVRAYVENRQLPLLNLTPSSFAVELAEVGSSFPALWTARASLIKPGQAHALKFKSTEHKYFVRVGTIEPSPYLPLGMGTHSQGIGSTRIRTVTEETGGVVIDGTLVAEEYLGVRAHDLLWFKLLLDERDLEFYAHVHKHEAVGPREARFRTVPAQLDPALVAKLKRCAGSVFPRSPYEVWPLLSSPCDLYSLAILAVRILLANTASDLPVIVDEFLSLANLIGKQAKDAEDPVEIFRKVISQDRRLLDLVSPHLLSDAPLTPEEARLRIQTRLWLETLYLVTRMIPDAGDHALCKSFGDVSQDALETAFDAPIQELENIIRRLRSWLLPGTGANEEISAALLKELALLS